MSEREQLKKLAELEQSANPDVAVFRPSTILALLSELEQAENKHMKFMLEGGPVVMATEYDAMKLRAEAAERERDALKFEVDMLDSDRDFASSIFRSIARGELRQQLMADNAHSAMKVLQTRKEESDARIAAGGIAAVKSLAGDLHSTLAKLEASEAALRTLRQASQAIQEFRKMTDREYNTKYAGDDAWAKRDEQLLFNALAAALAGAPEGGK